MWAPITWLIISTLLLIMPGSSFPKEDWLDRLWMDKWIHVGMFAILTWLWCLGIKKYQSPSVKLFLLIAFAATLYGVAMEFVQHYLVPNRSFDPGDMIADAAGSLLGFGFSWSRYLKK